MADPTVCVTNVSPLLNESHLRELFECCGTILKLQLDSANGRCIISYGDVSHARAALFLTGTPLGDRALTVEEYTGQDKVVNTGDPKSDEIARTIYVANLHSHITEDHIKDYFAPYGGVVAAKLIDNPSDPKNIRSAFVEFQSVEGANKALAIGNPILGGLPLKIRKSNNPIQKASGPKKDIDAIMSKVLAATKKLEKKVEGRKRSKSRESSRSRRSRRSRSRSKSRSRDRGRRRSRSRSNRRSRSRSRGGSSSAASDVRCYNCGEKGHISRNCKRSRSRSRSPPKAGKKKISDREGMYFDGYRWQPIETKPPMMGPNGALIAARALPMQPQLFPGF